MKKHILFLWIILHASICTGQIQTYPFQSRIIEEGSGTPLPFVTVFNKDKRFGTASNEDGFFVLPNNDIGDTIVITFLGYREERIPVTDIMPKLIFLSPEASTLNEIVVTAESDFLYELVSGLKRHKKTKSKTSKTYFFLETTMADEPIEIIEAYYNGTYSDHGMDNLNIKKGRIGVKAVNDRYFRSTESSRLFSLHDVFSKSYLFPESPLEMGKKELKKNYDVSLNHIFDRDRSQIYVVDIEARKDKKDLFDATVWIDRTHNRLVKVSLRISDASIHPFLPIGFNTLKEVDMEINKSYEIIDGDSYINTIDFNYNITYEDKWDQTASVTTKAFTRAYDFHAQFDLPLFEFSRHFHEDYRNMTIAPYDASFWENTTEFRFYDRLEEIEQFITQNKIDHRVLHPVNRQDSMRSQLQFPYIRWDQERFEMKEASEEVINKSKTTTRFEIERYHLSYKLYLDFSILQDTFVYQLYSILDPVDSYYHFQILPNDLAYMNMCFDLLEIQKREFDAELSKLTSPDKATIEQLYQDHIRKFEEHRKQLTTDTDRGSSRPGMVRWNETIEKALGINNLAVFGLHNTD